MKKPKLYKCTYEGCEWEGAILSKKLCPMHRSMELGKDKKPKKKYYIPKQTEKNKVKRKKARECLGEFFRDTIEKLKANPYSDESGDYISDPSSLNIAHIFFKRQYKSIQCNHNNYMNYTFAEHTKFDRYLDTRNFKKLEEEFSNTWDLVCNKIVLLLPIIEERGKFRESLENYINERDSR